MEEDKIIGFWQWFVKNVSVIQSCIVNEDSRQREKVVEQLNDQILCLGVFSWDLGLDEEDNWFLLISPNGNSEMHALSRAIMEQAPEHLDWLFYAGKPAKDWNRQFTVYDDFMEEQLIDASAWCCLVYLEDDGSVEFVIEARNMAHLDAETLETAAEQFVVRELGEELRIVLVSSIVVVEKIDGEDEIDKIFVGDLRGYLDAIF